MKSDRVAEQKEDGKCEQMLGNSRGEGQGGRGERAGVPPTGLLKFLYIISDLCVLLICACVYTYCTITFTKKKKKKKKKERAP